MKVDLYAFVGVFSRGLDTLVNILDKGAEFAAGQGTSEAEMLDWSLAPDMFPLRKQAQIVIDFAQRWPARAAGLDLPPTLDGEPTLAEIKAAAAAAKAYLATLKPEQFEGRDGAALTISLGDLEPTLPIGQWVVGFANTNFHFHLSTAYAILRQRGAPLGKRDLFAGGL